MTRPFAQWTFDTSNRLVYQQAHGGWLQRAVASIGRRLLSPLSRRFTGRDVVSASLFGRTLMVPAEHPLCGTMAAFPQYNSPLLLAVQAVAEQDTAEFTVIDVGANVGDTVAMIEQYHPGRGRFLCIEADARLSRLCKLNHATNARVELKQCFIGEREGVAVRLKDDGRANPSTHLVSEDRASDGGGSDRLTRLDTATNEFAEKWGQVSLIKVDTEGYDFSVLRSGPNLLKAYRPSIIFEWFPALLEKQNESPTGGFEYLSSLGYRHFAFFTNRGDFYCPISDPDHLFLRSLWSVALREPRLGYFDVFASMDRATRDRLVEKSIERMAVSDASRPAS